MRLNRPSRDVRSGAQAGFALVGLIVAIFIILLTLSVAAPTVARALRREREVEAVHRANDYVNAIRRYHLKTNTYPGSIEQLEKTNNIRYLRQKYIDPMTGKSDWRLIKVGENKTSVKGFFGQPLAGLNSTGIGSSGSNASAGGTNAGGASGSASGASGSSFGGSGFGGSSSFGSGSSLGSGGGLGATGSTATPSDFSSSFGSPSTSGSSSPGSTTGSSSSGGLGSNSASTFSGGGAPFLGVGLPTGGETILTVNEKTTYPEWEFLYDPRIEQLRSKVNIFGGGVSTANSSSLGALSGSQSSTPSNSNTPSTSSGSPTSPPQ